MNTPCHQHDVIDELIIRPVKKIREKKTIPMTQVFECNSKLKIKLPKTYEDKLDELQKRTTKRKK
tara:strand:+ start:920 stop:1114 length:195 start_codon:yes stop_codon:yes gene_type:complete